MGLDPPPKLRRVRLGIPSDEQFGGIHLAFIGVEANDRLRKALLPIIHRLCHRMTGCVHDNAKKLFPSSGIDQETGLFDPAVPPELRELLEAITAAADAAYAHGKEEGQSLIVGLARGDVSVAQFNEETIG